MLKKTHECFAVSIEDKVAHVVLNRPQAMNAMNKAFWNELPAIINEIDATAAARVIVISSAGKHFSAGMDLSVFGQDDAIKSGKADRYVAAEAFRSNIRSGCHENFQLCIREHNSTYISSIHHNAFVFSHGVLFLHHLISNLRNRCNRTN